MTPERFNSIVEAYGADPGRWPEAEREAARAFAQTGGATSPGLQAARELDALLEGYRLPDPAPGLAAAIAAQAQRTSARRFIRMMSAGLAAACAAGVVLGVGAAYQASEDSRTDAVIASAWGDPTAQTLEQGDS